MFLILAAAVCTDLSLVKSLDFIRFTHQCSFMQSRFISSMNKYPNMPTPFNRLLVGFALLSKPVGIL